MRRPAYKLLGLLSVLALVGCAEPAAYAPRAPGQSVGYTDEQLAQNRYRVTFTGNSVTPRETVENYLLLRSAEVTLQSGYRAFEFDTRDTKADVRYRSDFTGWPGWRGGYGWYWHSWAFGSPFGPPYESVDSYPITRYQAYAEIVMLTPEEAHNNPRAINAHDVITHVRPMTVPPPGPAPR
jgi:hypothetical protein